MSRRSLLPPTYPNKTQIHSFIDIIKNVFSHPNYINSKNLHCPECHRNFTLLHQMSQWYYEMVFKSLHLISSPDSTTLTCPTLTCPMPAHNTGHWYLFKKTFWDRNERSILCLTCFTWGPPQEYIERAFGVIVLGSFLCSIQTPGVPPQSPLTWL